MASQDTAPPQRKEPGLIGKSISLVMQWVVWLLVSLLLSYIIEWVGMSFFWQAEGATHSKKVLAGDLTYLNAHLQDNALTIKHDIVEYATKIKNQIPRLDWINRFQSWATHLFNNSSKTYVWANYFQIQYQPQFQAAMTVTQIFVIRLALIVFSLPVFFLAGMMGAVDGLVERDLRRWGGGRESSNVYNLARRSVMPAFVLSCVIYISLPFSVHPIIIILPFALLLGLAVRVGFERLKKYF